MRQGNYMGQNFGVVTDITDSEIELKELVQDGAGDWTERSSTLQLQQADQEYTGAKKMSAYRVGQPAGPRRRSRLRARGSRRLAASLALAVAGAALAQTANSIDQVTVSQGTSGQHDRQVHAEGAARQSAGRLRDRQARRGSRSTSWTRPTASAPRSATIDDPALRSLNVVQAGNRTRVVFNLNKPQTFETKVEGNTVLVTLFDQSDAASTQATQAGAALRRGDGRATSSTRCATSISGAARTAKAASSSICPTTRRASTSGSRASALIVDFLKTTLPRNLERRLDVRTSARRSSTVDTFAQGGNARMVIEPKGLWEHSAYQTDNRFIVEVKPIQEDPNKLTQGSRAGYKGEKLSLNFQNVEVRAVLQVIADFTGLNIITSDTVTGNLTLRLKDIPWDQALDIIMQTKGLDMRKNGNVVLIAPREELALKEKQQLEAQAQIGELEPLQTEIVPAQLRQGVRHPEHRSTGSRLGSARQTRHRRQGSSCPSAASRSSIRAPTSCSCTDIAVAARGSAPDHPPDRHARSARC